MSKQKISEGTNLPDKNQSIIHIALVVRDYDEAIEFFCNKLRFTLIEDTYQPEQNKRWVLVAPPGSQGTNLLLARASTPEQEAFIGRQTGGRVFLFLNTDDFWRDYKYMVSVGIKFVRPPKTESYGTVAVFEDLYGNKWDLIGQNASAEKAHQPYTPVNTMISQKDDMDAIRKLATDWSAGWNRGDIQELLSLYTDDPIMIPHGQPAVIGKNAIRVLYQSFFEKFTVEGKGKILDVQVSSDLGYLCSSYTLIATPKTGEEPIKGDGKSIFIVKRQDKNSWKIAILLDTSDRE